MDIESFNELIDLVRGLLEEQERVLRDTEETQKIGSWICYGEGERIEHPEH